MNPLVKFIYSEKATKFCKISPLLLITVHTVKNKGKISLNFAAFSEYMNFIKIKICYQSILKKLGRLLLTQEQVGTNWKDLRIL